MGEAGLVDAARRVLGSAPRPSLANIFVQGTKLLGLESGQYRIATIGSVTTDLIVRAIAVAAVQEGVVPVTFQGLFGAWRQEALDGASSFHRFDADLVVIATDWHDVISDLPLDLSTAQVAERVAALVLSFRHAWDAIRRNSSRRQIIQHLPALPAAAAGSISDLRTPASPRSQIAAVRAALLENGDGIIFLDCDGLGFDPAAWFGAKLPFAQDQLPDYVARFRSAFRQATGRVKKVLALDLDNTLWGGVIGDDGVDGLVLGSETPRGEAFAAFQAHVKALAAGGVVLAVCSKNDPEIAIAGLSHPHSALTRTDFQAFECNWTDKASALRRIAKTLNLGTDAIVFVDDNPAECALVREAAPEIVVIEMGDEPADFIARLSEGRWFENQRLTAEDMSRRGAYQARAQAAIAETEATDLDSFLRSLEMQSAVVAAEGHALARIAQLESKTNQFNLTTRRHNLVAIEEFAAADSAIVLAATLVDKFGDHGLVSSLIGLIQDDTLRVDSWLMSCRVFSRTLEQFVMRHLLSVAAERSLSRIVGEYIPTGKNNVVGDLYARLGFEPIGDSLWARRVDNASDDLITFVATRHTS